MAKVLIVEDEKNINELIKRNLQLVGHKCIQCFDGHQALKELYNDKFDLILLDVMLPGISGFDYEGETKTVDVHIQKLRKKLKWENEIKTIVKMGYRLET